MALLDSARELVSLARALGAGDAAVVLRRSRSASLRWRDGSLERLEDHTHAGASLELFVDGRYATSSTSDLRSEALRDFVERSIALARVLEPDPARGLPDPSLYPKGSALERDLDLYDASQASRSPEERLRQARELEEGVRAAAGEAPIVSVTSAVEDGLSESARVHSNGLEVERRGTSFGLSASVHLRQDDGRRPMGAAYSVRRHAQDLDAPPIVGTLASERAVRRMHSGKLPTGRYTVVVESRAVGRLVRPMLAPLSGAALQQKASLWQGKLDEPIASPLWTLVDDPTRRRGLGASAWHGDGLATERRPLIQDGVLRTYLISQYYARRLDLEPTGADLHDLEWKLGDTDLAGLCRAVGDGVLLDSFIGGNHNAATGELSVGCAGHRIRAGEIAEPIAEVNLTANLADLWHGLTALGSDPDPDSSLHCPSCVLENIQLSGV